VGPQTENKALTENFVSAFSFAFAHNFPNLCGLFDIIKQYTCPLFPAI
jgi:hypothetical protein